jgi:hypothetical protein
MAVRGSRNYFVWQNCGPSTSFGVFATLSLVLFTVYLLHELKIQIWYSSLPTYCTGRWAGGVRLSTCACGLCAGCGRCARQCCALSVSYLSPLFHTLSVQFLIPLSLSVCFRLPRSLRLTASFLSLGLNPESAPGIREDLMFPRVRRARPEPAKT